MEVWGIQIQIKYFVIAISLALSAGGLLFWFQHVRISRPTRRLSIPKLIFCVVVMALSFYYILNVVFGAGRTGWP